MGMEYRGTIYITYIIAPSEVKPFVLYCFTCGKLLAKLKFPSGGILWKLSTRAITVVRVCRALCLRRDSQHLAGQDIVTKASLRERERGREETDRESKRLMKQY